MAKTNKTGRRWCFVVVGLGSSTQMEEILTREKRIRYATWYVIKKERIDARGYIELRTPLKQTGMRKILGDTSIVCFAKREREEIISDIRQSKYLHGGPYDFGERVLNKGGRPKKRSTTETSKPSNGFYAVPSRP